MLKEYPVVSPQDLKTFRLQANVEIAKLKNNPQIGSPIKPAFNYDSANADDSNLFNSNNWNDPMVIKLREALMDTHLAEDATPVDFKITTFWQNDESLIVIKCEDKLFTLSWYKSRGKTESFTDVIANRPIEFTDFVDLYKLVTESD